MSDEVVSTDGTVNIPNKCPRCGKETIVQGDVVRCPSCGKLYYDQWLDIWRIDYDYECE